MARKALRAAIEKVVRGAPKCSSTRFTNGGTPATGAHESQRGAYLEERLEGPHVHRLGVGWSLRRTLSATNPIELCLSTVERMAERETVAGWGSAAALARHGLREAEKKFRA